MVCSGQVTWHQQVILSQAGSCLQKLTKIPRMFLFAIEDEHVGKSLLTGLVTLPEKQLSQPDVSAKILQTRKN